MANYANVCLLLVMGDRMSANCIPNIIDKSIVCTTELLTTKLLYILTNQAVRPRANAHTYARKHADGRDQTRMRRPPNTRILSFKFNKPAVPFHTFWARNYMLYEGLTSAFRRKARNWASSTAPWTIRCAPSWSSPISRTSATANTANSPFRHERRQHRQELHTLQPNHQ